MNLTSDVKNQTMSKKRHFSTARALLALLAFLAMPPPCYGQNRCAGGNWNYVPNDAANPCIAFTNGLKDLQVLPSGKITRMPTCTYTAPEYAWISGLDSELIQTLVPILDYVNSSEDELTSSGDPAKFGLEVTFTNRDPSTVIDANGLENAQWRSIQAEKELSKVYDTRDAKLWGQYLVLKFTCSRATCWRMTVHDFNCYKESKVDTAALYPDSNYKVLDKSFSINCDSEWKLGNKYCITESGKRSAYGEDDSAYWKLASGATAPENVHSVHLIPGVTFSGTYAGVPGGKMCSSINILYAEIANFNEVNFNKQSQVADYSFTLACAGMNFEKIIDHVFTTSPVNAVDIIGIDPDDSASATGEVWAGYFMLQISELAQKCASDSVCNKSCIRFDGVDLSQTNTIETLTTSVFDFMIDIPQSCSSFTLSTSVNKQRAEGLVTLTTPNVSPLLTQVSLSVGDKGSVETFTSVNFSITYKVSFGGQTSTYDYDHSFSYTNICESVEFNDPNEVTVSISHSSNDSSQIVTNLFDSAPTNYVQVNSSCAAVLKIVWDEVFDSDNFETFQIETSTGRLTTKVLSSPAATSTTKTVQAAVVIAGKTIVSKTLNIATTIEIYCTKDDLTFADFDPNQSVAIPFQQVNTVVDFTVTAPAHCGGFTFSAVLSESQGLVSQPQVTNTSTDLKSVKIEYGDQNADSTNLDHTITVTWTVTWTKDSSSQDTEQIFTYTKDCASPTFVVPEDQSVTIDYDVRNSELITTDLASYAKLSMQNCQSTVTSSIITSGKETYFSRFEIDELHKLESQVLTTAAAGTVNFDIRFDAQIPNTALTSSKVVTIVAQIMNGCEGNCPAACVSTDHFDIKSPYTIPFNAAKTSVSFTLTVAPTCNTFTMSPAQDGGSGLLSTTQSSTGGQSAQVTIQMGDDSSIDAFKSTSFTVSWSLVYSTGVQTTIDQVFSYTNSCQSVVFDDSNEVTVSISHSSNDSDPIVTNLFDFAPTNYVQVNSSCAAVLKIVWDEVFDSDNFETFQIDTSTGQLTTKVLSSPAATSTTKTVQAAVVIAGDTIDSKTLNIATTIGIYCTINDLTFAGFDPNQGVEIPFQQVNTVVDFTVSAPAHCGGFTFSAGMSESQGLVLQPVVTETSTDDKSVKIEYGDQNDVSTNLDHTITVTWSVTWTKDSLSQSTAQTFTYTNGCASPTFVVPTDQTFTIDYDVRNSELINTDLASYAQLSMQNCQSTVTSSIITSGKETYFSMFEIDELHKLESQVLTTAAAGTVNFDIQFDAQIANTVLVSNIVTIAAQITNNCEGNCPAECVSTDNFDIKSPYTIPFNAAKTSVSFTLTVAPTCNTFTMSPAQDGGSGLLSTTQSSTGGQSAQVTIQMGDDSSIDAFKSISFTVSWSLVYSSGVQTTIKQDFSYTNICESVEFNDPNEVTVSISHSSNDSSQIVTNLFDSAPTNYVQVNSSCAAVLKIVWDEVFDQNNFDSFEIDTSTGRLTTKVLSSPAATSTTKTVQAAVVIAGDTIVSKTLNIVTTIEIYCTIDDLTFADFDPYQGVAIPFQQVNTVVGFTVSAPAHCGGFTFSAGMSESQGLVVQPVVTETSTDDKSVKIEYGDQNDVSTNLDHTITVTWSVTWTKDSQSQSTAQTFTYTNGCASPTFVVPADQTFTIDYDVMDSKLINTELASYAELQMQNCQSIVKSSIITLGKETYFEKFEIDGLHKLESQVLITAADGTVNFDIQFDAKIANTALASKIVTIAAQITNNCEGNCPAECVSTDNFDIKSPYTIPFNAAQTSEEFTLTVHPTCNSFTASPSQDGGIDLLSTTQSSTESRSTLVTIDMGDNSQIDAFDSTSFKVSWRLDYSTGVQTTIEQLFSYTNDCAVAAFASPNNAQVTVTHSALEKEAIKTSLATHVTLANTLCQPLVKLERQTPVATGDDPRLATFLVNSDPDELTSAIVASHYTAGSFDLQVNAKVMIAGTVKNTKVIIVTLQITNVCQGTQLDFTDGQNLLTITHDAGITDLIITDGLADLTKLTGSTYNCDGYRTFALQSDKPTFLEVLEVGSGTSAIQTTLVSDAATTQTAIVDVQVELAFYDVVAQQNYVVDSRTAQVTIEVIACEVVGQTVMWPDTKVFQVRSNAWSTPIPEWSYNEHCSPGVEIAALQFFEPTLNAVLDEPDFIRLEAGNLVVDKDTKEITTSHYVVRFTQTNWRSETPGVLVTSTEEIIVEFVDNCNSADPSISTIAPFAISDMTTSVLRAYDSESPEPGQLQTFLEDPKPTLLFVENVSDAEQLEWNTGICGPIDVDFGVPEQPSEFITRQYWHTSAREDRWIKVLPTENSHINENGWSIRAKFEFVDYVSITVTVEFKVIVLPCEILALIQGQEYPNPVEYTIAQDPALPVNIVNFHLEPSCNYSLEYTIVQEPQVEETFISHPNLVDSTFTIFETELTLAGFYEVTISIAPRHPENQNNYYYTNVLGTELLTRNIQVELIDPCKSSQLIPSVEQVDLHLIIGTGQLFYEFPEYKDMVSERLDEQNGITDEDEIGYYLCGERITSIMELVEIDEKTEMKETDDYMSIYDSNDHHLLFLTYGTDDSSLAGSHMIEIDVSLANYPELTDQSGRLNLTLFEQQTDLTMPEVQFTLKSAPLPVKVPKLDFKPPLHSMIDEETGVDGGEMLVTAHLKLSTNKHEELPQKIGTFDAQNMVIMIECIQTSLVGNHEIVILYTGQGYLEGQQLQTEFNLRVLPEPVDFVYFGFLHLFDRQNIEISHELEVGEGWTFAFPSYEGGELNEVVLLGTANKFVAYNEVSDRLQIAEGATGPENIGSHKIKKQLINEDGLVLDELTITLQINGNMIDGDGSDQGYDNEFHSEIDFELIQRVGEFHHELIKQRVRQQLLLSIEEKKNIKPLKAKIQQISETGRVDILFSNPMVVIDQVRTMNDEGILTEKPTRMLEERKKRDSETKMERLDLGILDINVVPGSFSEPDSLGFSWEVIEYAFNKMVIQLQFDNPLMVSSTPDQEQIEIKFMSEDIFTDVYDFHLVEGTTLKRFIPQQVSSIKEKEILETMYDTLKAVAQGMFASNFFLNIFYSASLQYLWDLINTQQIIIILPLFNVQTPSSLGAIFNVLMALAAFEVLPTEWIYETYFYQGEGYPINDNFSSSGFEHHLLLNNFGSLGFVCVSFPLLMAALYFSEKCCSCFQCCKQRTKRYKAQMYWNAPLRVIIESYGIGCICCLLNMRHLAFDYTAKWVFANTILTFVVASVLIFFPIFALLFLYRNFGRLSDKELKERYGEVYEGYSTESKLMMVFWGLENLRKLGLAFVVVLTTKTFIAQMIVLFVTTLGLLCISLHVRTRMDRVMDIFNEVKLLLLMYHMLLFTMFVPDPVLKQKIGYSATVFLVVTTGVTMVLLVSVPFKLLRRQCAIKRAKNASKIAMQRHRPDVKAYTARRQKFIDWYNVQMQILNYEIEGEIAEEQRLQVIRNFNVENRRRRMLRLRRIREKGDSSESDQDDDEEQQPKLLNVENKKRRMLRLRRIRERGDSSESDQDDVEEQQPTPLNVDNKKRRMLRLRRIRERGASSESDDDDEEQPTRKVDVQAQKVDLPRPQIITAESQFRKDDKRPAAMTMTNNSDSPTRVNMSADDATALGADSQQSMIMDTQMSQLNGHHANRARSNASPYHQPRKVTWEELERLMQANNMSIQDVENIPGYENFEIITETNPVVPGGSTIEDPHAPRAAYNAQSGPAVAAPQTNLDLQRVQEIFSYNQRSPQRMMQQQPFVQLNHQQRPRFHSHRRHQSEILQSQHTLGRNLHHQRHHSNVLQANHQIMQHHGHGHHQRHHSWGSQAHPQSQWQQQPPLQPVPQALGHNSMRHPSHMIQPHPMAGQQPLQMPMGPQPHHHQVQPHYPQVYQPPPYRQQVPFGHPQQYGPQQMQPARHRFAGQVPPQGGAHQPQQVYHQQPGGGRLIQGMFGNAPSFSRNQVVPLTNLAWADTYVENQGNRTDQKN